jgi:hypothetical protein
MIYTGRDLVYFYVYLEGFTSILHVLHVLFVLSSWGQSRPQYIKLQKSAKKNKNKKLIPWLMWITPPKYI